MSGQQRGPPRGPGGGPQKGSVRQARERMEADLQDRARVQAQAQKSRPQMPPALAESRNAPGAIGVAISRPTQVPQWPLADGGRSAPSNAQYQPPVGRAIPPQRPQRPSRIPSMLDPSRLQEPTPSFQNRPQAVDQNPNVRSQDRPSTAESPIITSPVTPSSRQSTNSSIGTIPDFPVPMMPPQAAPTARRNNGLGPPPSTRRGTSSYYSQTSLVSPIPEESQGSDKAHDSYASSAAMPSTWDPDLSRYDDEYEDGDMYEGRGYASGHWPHETIEEGRESRESNVDDNDDRGLIRSASLGKRAKPSVVTTKTADKPGQRSSPEGQKSKAGNAAAAAAAGAAAGVFTATAMKDGQRETVWPMMGTKSPLASGTGFIDSNSSSDVSELSKPGSAGSKGDVSPIEEPTVPIPTQAPEQRSATPLANRRLSALRRPRNLDINAVRDAEARGSLTSLPDLIRRATRLAAMMDRGKRPGSRLNDLSDFPTAAEIEKGRQLSPEQRRQSTLSGMLAAFPPPGLATPSNVGTPRQRRPSWPAAFDNTSPDLDEKEGSSRGRRRCCGLPIWGFLLVLLIILIVIAAAVVVPVELLVVHKKNASQSSTQAQLQQCQSGATTECKNGGSSVIAGGGCSCICINGFTGPTCSVGGTTGCTSTSIDGLSDATLGYSIPRLLSDAESNFSIPIVPSIVLGRFNSGNLSCISENALVTFDGQTGADSSKEVTRTYASKSTTSTSSAPASTSQISTTDGFFSATFNSTTRVQDFARVAVLFLLQEDNLEVASTAQYNLQGFFDKQKPTNEDALNITLGSGNFINLVELSVELGNGTTFGGMNETIGT